MRVALDTNVLVAAFATRGLCSDLFRLVLAEHDLVVTDVVLKELGRVLTTKLGLPSDRRDGLIAFLQSFRSTESESVRHRKLGLRDKDDEQVLASVIAAGADVLVSGDKDLLEAVLPTTLPLRVVSPRGFWELLRGRSASPDEVHEP